MILIIQTLTVVYKGYDKSFEELLKDNNTTSSHQNHIRVAVTNVPQNSDYKPWVYINL